MDEKQVCTYVAAILGSVSFARTANRDDWAYFLDQIEEAAYRIAEEVNGLTILEPKLTVIK